MLRLVGTPHSIRTNCYYSITQKYVYEYFQLIVDKLKSIIANFNTLFLPMFVIAPMVLADRLPFADLF